METDALAVAFKHTEAHGHVGILARAVIELARRKREHAQADTAIYAPEAAPSPTSVDVGEAKKLAESWANTKLTGNALTYVAREYADTINRDYAESADADDLMQAAECLRSLSTALETAQAKVKGLEADLKKVSDGRDAAADMILAQLKVHDEQSNDLSVLRAMIRFHKRSAEIATMQRDAAEALAREAGKQLEKCRSTMAGATAYLGDNVIIDVVAAECERTVAVIAKLAEKGLA